MKKTLTIICSFCLTIFSVYPVLGQPVPQFAKDRQINELSNRVAILDSTWGRFQIGGNFELDTTSTLSQGQNTLIPPDFKQQLGLSLDANIDQNLQLSLKFLQIGNWGVSTASFSPTTTIPLQVDEAFLKLSYLNTLDYLGRFKFSLGPLGLLSDFYVSPVEGLAFQKAFKSLHVIGVYSRVLTQYTTAPPIQIESTTNYLVTRIGWSNQSTIIGLNLVPGLSGEKSFSLDCSSNREDSRFATEIGWYSFNSSNPDNSDYKVAWTPGFLISYGKTFSKNNYLQLKVGYIGDKFQPIYSSLNQETREWFTSNSQGVELYLQNGLKNGYGLENRLIYLTPLISYPNQLDSDYRWRSCIVKHFSPVNQLQLGIDLKSFDGSIYNQIFATWVLQF